jgi:hypothetical protein
MSAMVLTAQVADDRECGQVEGSHHACPTHTPDVLETPHEPQTLVFRPATQKHGHRNCAKFRSAIEKQKSQEILG